VGGKFKITVNLTSPATAVNWMAIGTWGEVETQFSGIYMPAWEQARSEALEGAAPRAWTLSAGLGVTQAVYAQETLPTYRGWLLTGTMAASFRFMPSPWDVAMSGYATIAPLAVSDNAFNVRFFGFNARVGWLVPLRSNQWTLKLMVGGYYTTTAVAEDEFGYAGIGGPQIYPVVTKMLGPQNILSGYFKFSPVSDGLSVLHLGNREIALGVAWMRKVGNFNLRVSLDVAELRLNLVENGGIVSRTASLGIGLAL